MGCSAQPSRLVALSSQCPFTPARAGVSAGKPLCHTPWEHWWAHQLLPKWMHCVGQASHLAIRWEVTVNTGL